MNNDFYFSVIIPVYNAERTIIRALNSIKEQTFSGSIEVIIIDDGSFDSSRLIINDYIKRNEFNDLVFKFIYQVNSGVSVARNRGLNLAQGKYICFLDSDDFFHKSKLEFISEFIAKNSDADIIGHDFDIGYNEINAKLNSYKKVGFFRILVKNFAATPCVIIKNRLGVFFDESMKYTEDHDFFLRLSYLGFKFYYINTVLTFLDRDILSVGGLSSNRLLMRLGEVKMYYKLIKENKFFIFVFPFLFLFSLIKAIIKLVR